MLISIITILSSFGFWRYNPLDLCSKRQIGVCAGTLVYKCICLSVRLLFSREKANSFSISHPGISLRERGWLINHNGYSILFSWQFLTSSSSFFIFFTHQVIYFFSNLHTAAKTNASLPIFIFSSHILSMAGWVNLTTRFG